MNKTNPQPDQAGDSAGEFTANQPSNANPRRRLSLWKKLAFLSVVLMLFFAAVEILLVLLGISYPLLYQTDEFCATRLKSNLNVRYVEEGNAVVQTNSAGFRDQARQLKKPGGVYRIAVVGDSFCEAIQVAREETFCFRLEEKLAAQDIKAEVLNFGVSGFGTAQEFEMLRHYVLDYEPDLVILAVFLGNDVGDNSRTINAGQIKPYYDLVNGELKLDDSFRKNAQYLNAKSGLTRFKSQMINGSRILQFGNKLYSRWKSRGQNRANIGIGLDPNLYRPPESKQWKEAWVVTEALLKAFDRKCKGSHAECLVLTLSNPIQVHPSKRVRQSFKEENQIESLFYPDDRVKDYCVANQIPVLQLAKTFLNEAIQSDPPIYFHGFKNTKMGTGHWNEIGHRRVAEILADHLTENFIRN